MKFFTASQIRQLDQVTIAQEPVASIDLMERAAQALFISFTGTHSHVPVCIIAGQGNNGGDALALSRLLLQAGYPVKTYLVCSGSLSPDCEANRQQLLLKYPASILELKDKFVEPEIQKGTVIVDGLFGSGLSRPLSGIYSEIVAWINQTGCQVVSIDIPSGLSGEENKVVDNPVIVKANLTLTLQFPKLAFLLPENATYVGCWKILGIGILPQAIEQESSNWYYLEDKDIAPLLKKRQRFSHKGTFGHALIVAGSKGMAGASVLSSMAALRSGAGLISVHGAAANRIIVQTAVPEAIFKSDPSEDIITRVEITDKYNAIAIGPGIGTSEATANMLQDFFNKQIAPCVIDADALNILSTHKELLKLVPKNSILTPHPKEFDRLFGKSTSSYERLLKAQQASETYGFILVLKGANTAIASPDGNLYFNSTGNSGMATAGSGDVLTGIIAGLLAQGYSPKEASITGVFLHGRSGDLALQTESKESLLAGDIISNLGGAFRSIRDSLPVTDF